MAARSKTLRYLSHTLPATIERHNFILIHNFMNTEYFATPSVMKTLAVRLHGNLISVAKMKHMALHLRSNGTAKCQAGINLKHEI